MKEWETIKLGDAATFINGYAFKPADWKAEGLEIIRIQNLTKGNSSTNFYDGEIKERYKVVKGDYLISWSATLGIYEWNGNDAWLNQHIFKVVFDKKEFDKSYFKHLIAMSLEAMGRETHGSTMKHITKPRFDSFKIPYPPLAEQQKIAAILDAADTLRQKDQQLIDHYTTLSQSLFLDMFGDPVTNPMGWGVKKMVDTSRKITDGEHQNPPAVGEGINLIMAKDVLDDRVDFSKPRYVSSINYDKYVKKCNPENGDVLLVSRGATVGRCTVVNTKTRFCLMGSVILIKPDTGILGLYISYIFKHQNFSKELVNVSSASAQQAIYISHLKKLIIPTPPITLQNQFAERIQQIEAQKQQAQASLEHSEALFNSLLQRAFSGELSSPEPSKT